jgi:hypothetical protein
MAKDEPATKLQPQPVKLAAVGLRHVSEPVWARLQAQEAVRAALDFIPSGVRLRVVDLTNRARDGG